MPVPEEVKEKVIAYGKGMLSPWVPQQLILEHGVRRPFPRTYFFH